MNMFKHLFGLDISFLLNFDTQTTGKDARATRFHNNGTGVPPVEYGF